MNKMEHFKVASKRCIRTDSPLTWLINYFSSKMTHNPFKYFCNYIALTNTVTYLLHV